MALSMSAALAVNNPADMVLPHAKQFGKSALFPSGQIKLADRIDLRTRETGVPIPLACRSPVLAHHVGNVLGARAGEQMGRVAAKRIVASMANIVPFWDGMAGEYEGGSVRPDRLVPQSKCPVPVAIDCTAPSPAGVRPTGFVNHRPESIRVRDFEIPAPVMPPKESGRDSRNRPVSGVGLVRDGSSFTTPTLAISYRYIHSPSISCPATYTQEMTN